MTNLTTFRCPKTAVCENDRCLWRQFLVHGYHIYASPDPATQQEMGEHNMQVTEKYGESFYPRLSIRNGTDCIWVDCEDYVGSHNGVDPDVSLWTRAEIERIDEFIRGA